MSIQELKEATANLPPNELAEFAAWLDEYRLHSELSKTQVTFEDIKHLAGSFEGPGDLTTNPKYMDDFGKSSMR